MIPLLLVLIGKYMDKDLILQVIAFVGLIVVIVLALFPKEWWGDDDQPYPW